MAEKETPQMTDTTHSHPAVAADDEALRKKLLSRIAVAGVTIVGLLGGLAVYDALNRPEAPSMPKMAAVPEEERPEPKPEPKVEEKSDEEKLAEATAEESAAETQAAATPQVPEGTETPIAPPVAEEKTPKTAKPLTPPAAAVATSIKPPARAAAGSKPDAQREFARVIPEETRPLARAQSQPPPQASASRPLGQVVETAKRFLVQVGVFSNRQNAEELVARLTEAGIPARIESHVQVGPFASRAEVEAARAKLRALGLEDGMLVRR